MAPVGNGGPPRAYGTPTPPEPLFKAVAFLQAWRPPAGQRARGAWCRRPWGSARHPLVCSSFSTCSEAGRAGSPRKGAGKEEFGGLKERNRSARRGEGLLARARGFLMSYRAPVCLSRCRAVGALVLSRLHVPDITQLFPGSQASSRLVEPGSERLSAQHRDGTIVLCSPRPAGGVLGP